MPRNKKSRRIGYMSSIKHFAPIKRNAIVSREENKDVILTNEEFETIRLIDYKGYTQVECSKSMNKARTTVQQLYTDARYKISQMLIDARHLFVEGGTVEVFDDEILEREVGIPDDYNFRMRQRRHRNRQNRNNFN